ncbi:PDZ domain-containing protein [Roseovarius faecimaris]|uniref:PDZ domain-containing protein n=1 Tax=Roseovarius faecimaris TaxID=2494550 RepID=A0A6I6IQB5_9RHOB|nr:trypsin-like peptidase domain-containing protein [Roseovarius faecimaris]QGX97667.1 PDZ domain-containing protein [Roseovarius faecimaris]
MFRATLACLILLTSPLWAETRVPASQAEISLGFVPVVKSAAPAVVNIYAKRIVNVRASPFSNDPFFQNLFRDFGAPRQRVQNSLGSGVILSGEGIVVSNYHVVGEATDIRVVLNDRREFSGRVLLSDEESDLAILQLDEAQDLPALPLRDSDTVEVGELVLAIGNPFGVGQTVSSGIVSGLARSGTAMGNTRGYFIQTDAPINPGNSGGALVDVNGALIGINTSILSRSGGSNGIGFAIPSALVAEFVAQAQAGKTRFERPWAGVTGQPVDADLAEVLQLDRPGGIVLSEFHEASPLKAAGLIPGDVITDVDGVAVNTPAEMVYRMTVAGLGQEAVVTRVREGRAEQVTLSLIAPPDDPPRGTLTTSRRTVFPGITLEQVNPAVIAEMGLPLNSQGVVVADPGQTGARAGMQRGDILLGINGKRVDSPEEAEAMLREVRGRLALDIGRGNRRVTLRFRL